jgi:hypothetical protein
MAGSLALVCLLAALGSPPVLAEDGRVSGAGAGFSPQHADFQDEQPSQSARQMADWVLDARDSPGMPFVIVDKMLARVFVFHPDGRLRGASAALLGLAVGDDAVPGIGGRKLSSIRPHERTTPAGRFVAALDHNLHGAEILWVDYDGAVSLHPVVAGQPAEHRAQRLASPTPLDNRISYGCINVPVDFFRQVVSAAFAAGPGIVYVLPETRPLQKVFAWYDVDGPAGMKIRLTQR